MDIIYLTFGLFVILAYFDFKKAVLFYAPWKLFFNFNVRFGPVTYDLALSVLFLVIFFLKRKTLVREGFPFAKSFVIYGVLYTLSCLLPHPVYNFIPRIVIMVLAFAYIYYYCLDSRNNIKFAISSYALFAIIMCVNGLLAPLYGINPLDDFLQSVAVEDDSIFLDNEWLRMGNVRYRSFIPHAISYGVACVIILYLMVWYYISEKLSNEKIFNLYIGITTLLLFSGVIICGSRTPIIGILPFGYLFINSRILPANSRRLLILGIIAALLVSGEYIIYSIQTLLDSKMADDAGGSSTDLRIEQFSIGWQWMKEDLIWGKGMDFDAFAANSAILGAESVWLPLMINNGLVGVLSYIIFYYYIIKRFPTNRICRIYLFMITIGWLLMRTATSLIGVTDVQFLTIFFCIYRNYQLKESDYATIHYNPCIQCS